MKKIYIKIVVSLIFFAIVLWITSSLISSHQETTRKVEEEKQKKSQIEEAVGHMVQKYNAVTNWQETLNAGDILKKIYTMQVKNILIRCDGRTILIFASVDDIDRHEGKFVVHFCNVLSFNPNLHFFLECDSVMVRKIINQQPRMFEEYAVIASILSVKKLNNFESSRTFVAEGRCLDLMFIGYRMLHEK